MQASREDELSAAAGDIIIIAGEYKNPGWVWASHVGLNGQAAGDYRLCPANYFTLLQPPPPTQKISTLQSPGHVQGPLSTLRDRAIGNVAAGLEADDRVGGALALPGEQAAQEIAHVPSSLSARDRQQAHISAARLTLQQTPDLLTYDEASIYGPPSSGFGILPREETMMIRESLVDMDDPILDGMFEDEAGRISVQC